MTELKHKRVLLKLSGEAIESDDGDCISFDAIGCIADEVAQVRGMGVDVALVVGGGNIFRGVPRDCEAKLERATGDYMGMLATVINALAIQSVLEARGVATRVMSAIEMPPVAEPYIRRRALRHLEKGRVVIFGGGTGNPFFTTDTAAALRASEMGSEVLFKATRVDGIYDSDPLKNSDATRYEELSFTDVLTKDLKVMDSAAVSLCRENNIPIIVFNLMKQGNIIRALKGEPIGTIVKGE